MEEKQEIQNCVYKRWTTKPIIV